MGQFRMPQKWLRLIVILSLTISFLFFVTIMRDIYNKEMKQITTRKKLKELFDEFKKKAEEVKEVQEEEEDDAGDYGEEDYQWKIVAHYPPLEEFNEHEDQYCGDYHCRFQTDLLDYSSADAVIVDGYLLSQAKDQKKPVRSSPDQAWIFYSKEPWSSYSQDFPYGEWNSIFNWTFTYHLNSHFLLEGMGLVRGPGNYEALWGLQMKPKTKAVLWIANQCQTDSRREDYVAELEKYIQVDIKGDCGDQTCSEDNEKPSCYEDYHFVLAFEKTLCADYVTDEFYKTIRYPTVPIVRGGANYTRLFNKNLFINTADFYSPKHLAEHLTLLMQSPKSYREYLRTRVKYLLMERTHNRCVICSHLYHLNESRSSYTNIARWMDTCRKPTDVLF